MAAAAGVEAVAVVVTEDDEGDKLSDIEELFRGLERLCRAKGEEEEEDLEALTGLKSPAVVLAAAGEDAETEAETEWAEDGGGKKLR